MADEAYNKKSGSPLPSDKGGEAIRPHRPRSVTILACLLFLAALWNMARLAQTLAQWDILNELLPFSPLYPAASGAVWGLSGLALSWGFWRGQRWAWRLYWFFLGAYTVYFWSDRFFLAGYVERYRNWPFLLSLNLLLFVYNLWALSRQKTRTFFGVTDERESKDPTIT